MAGPWEKYQKASESAGPWTKYQGTESKGPSEASSALRGVAGGLTAGFDDELTGVIGGAGRIAGVKNLGSWKPFDPNSHLEMADKPLSADEIVNAYRENRDAIRNEQAQDLETNPKATIGGNLVGAVMSPAGKIGAPQKMGPLSKSGAIVQDMKTAALQGAAFGAGGSNADLTRGEVGEFAADTALGAGMGAVVPPALVGVKGAVKKGTQAAGWAGKKVFSSAFGVGEETVKKYLANPDRINNARSLSEVKDLVDEGVGRLRDAVESGKVTEVDAKEALRAMKDQVTRGLSDKKVDAKDALRAADTAFSGARERVLAPLKTKSAPTQHAADVSAMVGQLKAKIQAESGRALETLKDSGEQVDLGRVFTHIDETITQLKGAGTDESLAVIAKLQAYKDRLAANRVTKQVGFQPSGKLETLKQAVYENEATLRDQKIKPARWINGSTEDQWLKDGLLGKQVEAPVEFQAIGPRFGSAASVGAPEAKKLIQGLDAITEYSPMAGSFDKAKNKAFKGIRGTLDQSLKEGVPEYRAQMDRLAPEVRLLDDANHAFGSPEVAVGKLGRMNTPRGEFDRATLGRLEESVGKVGSVTKEADEFARAQKILKDPQALRQIEQGLPEYQSLRQAMADVAKRNPKWTRQQIEQATAKERRTLAQAMSRRVFAESRLAPFKGLAPGSTENKIKSVMKGEKGNIQNRETLGRLGKETGQDYLQMADDLAVKDAFDKPYHHGARNTLLWTVVGTAMGGLPGAGLGASYGQLVDRYGPKMAKSILDGVMKVKNSPSVKTIQGLGLPDGVKKELEREFKLYVITQKSGGSAASRVAEGQAKGEDRWAQSGLDKLGIKDGATTSFLLQSKEGKRLLIEASDLPPGSIGAKRIKERIDTLTKGIQNDSLTDSQTQVPRLKREPARGR